MNTRILLLAISVAALSSCSSVYKSGQTPDDVYYSPAPARVQANNNNNNDDSYVDVRQQKAGTNYQSYEQYADNQRDDRFLRMSVGNPYYMNAYNSYGGFDWRSNSFYDGFNYGFSSPWNNYFAWNNFYNPYCIYTSFYPGGYGGIYYGGGYSNGGYYGGGYGNGVKYTTYTTPPKPRVFNVNNYTNGASRGSSSGRTYSNNNYYNNSNRYNNTNNNNNRSNNGNTYYNNNNNNGRSYTPSNSNSNSNNNTYTPSRTYTPAPSSGGGGGGSSSGGGGGVSRPSRGN